MKANNKLMMKKRRMTSIKKFNFSDYITKNRTLKDDFLLNHREGLIDPTIEDIRKVLKPVKGELDDLFNNYRKQGPIFCCSPIRYSPRKTKGQNEVKRLPGRAKIDEVKAYFRKIDIEKIREQRIMNSFALGRRIAYKENTDEKIGAAIENLLERESKKAINYLKAGLVSSDQVETMTPNKIVFESLEMRKRTDAFYKQVASELLKQDLKKDKKKYGMSRRKGKKGSPRTKIKFASIDSPCPTIHSSSNSIYLLQSTRIPKLKLKLKKHKISYKQQFDERKEHLAKFRKLLEVKRIFGDSTALSPNPKEEELDSLLDSCKPKHKKFTTFYSRNKSMDESSRNTTTPSSSNMENSSLPIVDQILNSKICNFSGLKKLRKAVYKSPKVNTTKDLDESFLNCKVTLTNFDPTKMRKQISNRRANASMGRNHHHLKLHKTRNSMDGMWESVGS